METTTAFQAELPAGIDPAEACAALRRPGTPAVLLGGALPGGTAPPGAATRERLSFGNGWRGGPLLALGARRLLATAQPAGVDEALARLDRRVTERRRRGGTPDTGVVALLAYEALAPPRPPALDSARAVPLVAAWEVDRSLRFDTSPAAASGPRLTVDGAPPGSSDSPEALVRALEACRGTAPVERVAGGPLRHPRTSLPRERYIGAVRSVLDHVRRGDVYQANLCQRFEVPHAADPLAIYRAALVRTPAPRAAFVEDGPLALVSLSPETFADVDAGSGRIETRPIKGTRPRGATVEADAAARRQLERSDKDHAELLMIVDLERNDLSRLCRPGSVRVPELARLHSFATVHHLVARVEGRLRDGVGPAELLRATFPGGSITGAPKLRAMQLLRELEPVARSWYTGCLLWFADDGSLDSSILIRSLVCRAGTILIGAGGGVVADSDPEGEWRESNDKVRALTRLLGFEPEEAA